MDQIHRYVDFPCIIPTIVEDYLRMHTHFIRLFYNLRISKLIFIGPATLKSYIDKDISDNLFCDYHVEFLDESSLIELKSLKPTYDNILKNSNSEAPSSINWYYQQFLKMAYSRICPDDYYLCWDSDTIPLRPITMFNPDKIPYFDVKTEFQNSYFLTIEKLFHSRKIIEKSFISEHMLFNTILMQKMLEEIENTELAGISFGEKILSAVGSDNLRCGFSEFETYGTFIGLKYPASYKIRNWFSFRNANFFVDISDLNDDDVLWLSKEYDAATFEKYQPAQDFLTETFRNPRYREKLTPKQFYMSILESGILGDYENGMLRIDDRYYPV